MRKPTVALFFSFIFIFLLTIKAQGLSINEFSSGYQGQLFISSWKVLKDYQPKSPLIFESLTGGDSLDVTKDLPEYEYGNWIIKTELNITDSLSGDIVYALTPNYLFSAYEIYWDSEKIFQNGIIGTDYQSEVPGKYFVQIPVAHRLLQPGQHTLIIRLSCYRDYSKRNWGHFWMIFGNYKDQLEMYYERRYVSFLFVGFFLVAFIINLFLFLTRKGKLEHLLFTLVCTFALLDFLFFQWSSISEVTTTYIHVLVHAYYFLPLASIITLMFYLIVLFSMNRYIIVPVIIVNVFVHMQFFSIWYAPLQQYFFMLQIAIISSWALFKKREGSLTILVGVFIALLTHIFRIDYIHLYLIIVLTTIFHFARQFATKEIKQKEAQVRSTRLENELLKKNINPHFLMNTLTSIIVWLRKEPDSAIQLIEALSDEFRIITQISSLDSIPLEQEIELCKLHIKIMNYRKGSDFRLEVFNLIKEVNVPPMILHTLIENGITHGYENKNHGVFIIEMESISQGYQFIVKNDGEFEDEEMRDSTGIGLKYVKTRLEESYPGKWKLDSGANEKGWITKIEIRNK